MKVELGIHVQVFFLLNQQVEGIEKLTVPRINITCVDIRISPTALLYSEGVINIKVLAASDPEDQMTVEVPPIKGNADIAVLFKCV